ncbi:MAG: SufD family Fe-S cluster assembly protein [Bifidobacteriaceae bacterium]|jgi:Fe-S cluster assembly protein SufD|nr:SufD family Fe-S cluster assembly protein [Bifidobacteriaceae bacterium]
MPPVATASRADRPTSYDLAAFPPVTGAEEEWRFTPVERLRALLGPDFHGGSVSVEVDDAGPHPSDPGSPVRVERVGRDDPRLGQTPAPSDRAGAAAWAGFAEATIITVAPGAIVGGPIRVRCRGNGASTPDAIHLAVVAGTNAQATVVLEHSGCANVAETVELQVAEGANVRVLAIHEWDEPSVHTSSHRARLAKDATLAHGVVTLGGGVVRHTADVVFAGPGGTAELLGLNLTDTGHHHEARLFVDHAAAQCTSRVTYKGALLGAGGHSVWVGDVLIRKAAVGTDTYEENRNLVLARGARADSVPNLEIETGEIRGAGHASATGRFDDEQVFYLRSRGIDLATARRLVVHAFFAELIGRLGVAEMTDHLTASVDRALDASMTPAEIPSAAHTDRSEEHARL